MFADDEHRVHREFRPAAAHGLRRSALANLDGKGYVRSRVFWEEVEDLPGSTIKEVVVEDDEATVDYVQPDGKTEQLTLVKEEGGWKVEVDVPPAVKK